ncbi:MAG: hypothetical protein V1733_01045 [bacterium]
MKRPYAPYYLVLFTLISVCSGLKSQDFVVDAAGERIQVCTDRTMYMSGEKVLFSAVIFNIKDLFAEEFSRTFYCELITPDGKKIAGRKYLLQNSSGQGCLTIPEETISGIYFLKFYTRFMRNISTDEYKYIMLKIINPFKTEVLSGNDAFDTTDLAGNNVEVLASDQSLNILSGKKTFSPREEIRLNIRGNTGKGLPAKLCLSVIPESTYEDPFFPDKNKLNTANNGVYLPETRGISLSGQLIGKESGKPVPDAKVNLSIIGDKDILVVRTDSSGRFFFALPDYNGNKDIFLCADDLPDITPEILIDNDFCSKPVYLSSPLFTLNEAEMKAAYKLAVNSRITSMFRENIMAGDSPGEENNTPFYGEPSDVLLMEKYIDLPTLGEYFTELPVAVKLRKGQGRKQFRFYTTQADMSIYDPLMLVDWVAVNDIEKILAMSPLEIERIELVDCPYVKGNITYGGIISFVSKKNDFAGIDLPTSGTFVNYRFLEECTENIPPGPSPGNIPDSRNTVYWNPAVQTNDDGTAGISFPAPDTPGKYYILLRGMSLTGEVVLTEEMIVVMED